MRILAVKRASNMSATGPRRLRSGSKRPQSLFFAWAEAVGAGAVVVSSRSCVLERLRPLPGLPPGARNPVGREELTAVRRAAVMEVA